MNNTLLFILWLAGLWAGFVLGGATAERKTTPSVGPGEICHCDSDGLCSITKNGRIVTRVQI